MNPQPAAAPLATAPPVERTPMHARPWAGLLRGLARGLRPGPGAAPVPAGRVLAAERDVLPWEAAARRRRRVLLATVGALALLALLLQAAPPPAAITVPWLAHVALATLLFAWVGSGLVTALMGMWVMLRGDRHALALPAAQRPIDKAARTAVVMPICNEDIATVFSGLRATCESLAATGTLALFDFYVLSDTADPALRAAEQRAWERLRRLLGDAAVAEGGRVFYRWRRRRTRRKAGNVADFCRRWGGRYRYMVVLDADSTMRGDTLVALVRLMEHHPRAGIVQTLPQSHGQPTLHARAQQFCSRVTGRLYALGMAYWQLGESHYWGHNAILRVEPFMRHCALAPLAGRGGLAGEILSHDFVEAALMRRAGYEVWLAPQLEGSWEQHPPNLLDELQRDRRWCQGNLQNARLIAEPGWQPVHRVMFAVGALSYALAPLWLAFVALGLVAHDAHGHSWALWLLTLALLLLPRALGVLAAWLGGEHTRYGGLPRLLAGTLLELALSAAAAPLRMLAHSAFVLGALTGLRLEWKSPPRGASAVGWREAWARIGALALAACAGLLLALPGSGVAEPAVLLPLALPLLLAVPFTVLTGSPRVGAAAQRRGWLTIPDEQRPALVQARAAAQHGFRDFAAAAASGPVGTAPFGGRRRWAAVAVAAVLLSALLLPRPGFAPGRHGELDAATRQGYAARLDPRGSAVAAADSDGARRSRVAADRPARMIDNALRRRALKAVQRALEQADESSS
jgi:membrane glycosyltransferase